MTTCHRNKRYTPTLIVSMSCPASCLLNPVPLRIFSSCSERDGPGQSPAAFIMCEKQSSDHVWTQLSRHDPEFNNTIISSLLYFYVYFWCNQSVIEIARRPPSFAEGGGKLTVQPDTPVTLTTSQWDRHSKSEHGFAESKIDDAHDDVICLSPKPLPMIHIHSEVKGHWMNPSLFCCWYSNTLCAMNITPRPIARAGVFSLLPEIKMRSCWR